MSKILFIGDPHHKFSQFNLGCNFIDWVTKTVIKEKPDIVVNLGDHMDTHGVLRSEILKIYIDHVKEITNQGINYVHLLGNHEWHKNGSCAFHALEVFKEITYKNYYVVDKQQDLFDMTFVPYIHDFNDFPLQTLPICVAHQTFIGADYGYYRPDVGVDADKVSAEIIISGHIHKRQTFGKVIYPGTPYAQSVDDINQSKGIMIFNTKTYKTRYIESPMPSWRGAKFEVSPDLHIEISGTVNETDHWIIDITGPKSEINSYLNSEDFLQLKQRTDLRVRSAYTDKQKTKIKIQSITMSNIVGEYVDKIYNGAIDKKIIKDKALNILSKVKR